MQYGGSAWSGALLAGSAACIPGAGRLGSNDRYGAIYAPRREATANVSVRSRDAARGRCAGPPKAASKAALVTGEWPDGTISRRRHSTSHCPLSLEG